MAQIDDTPLFAQADLVPALRRHRWLLVTAVVFTAGCAYFLSALQAPVYEAEARLLLEDPRDAGVFGDRANLTLDPQRYVRNQAELVNSAPVLARTAELFDAQLSIDELDRRVEARASTDLDLVTIRADDSSPQGAARLANKTAEAYQQLVAEEVEENADAAIAELSESTSELRTTIASAERRLEGDPDDAAAAAERDAAVGQLMDIESRADQLSVDASLYGSGVRLFEEATAPDGPARPQPARNALVAAVLALLGAATYAWWRSGQAPTADHPHDPAGVLRARLLGDVASFDAMGVEGESPTISDPHSVPAQSYQFVMSAIDFVFDDDGPKAIMLTSCKPGDGKTITSLNLAIAARTIGRHVILVDADKRRYGLTELAAPEGGAGLAELVDDGLDVGSCIASVEIDEERVVPMVPAGRPVDDPAAFFRTARFRQAFERLRRVGDLIVVDSPPLLAVADTSAIAANVDGIVVVVERGTPRGLLEELRRRLDFVGTPVLGYVFNRADPRRGAAGYGYGPYGYGDGVGASLEPGGRLRQRLRRFVMTT